MCDEPSRSDVCLTLPDRFPDLKPFDGFRHRDVIRQLVGEVLEQLFRRHVILTLVESSITKYGDDYGRSLLPIK